MPDGLQALFVQVHLPFVLLDDVLRQKRWPIADEIGLEVVQDDAVFVFDKAVDDTVNQQVVPVLFRDLLEDPAGGYQERKRHFPSHLVGIRLDFLAQCRLEEQRDLFHVDFCRHGFLQQAIAHQFKQQLRDIRFRDVLRQIHRLHHEMRCGPDFGACRRHSFLHEFRAREVRLDIARNAFCVRQIELQHMRLVRVLEQALDLRHRLVARCRRRGLVGIFGFHQRHGQPHLLRQGMVVRLHFSVRHLFDLVLPFGLVDVLQGDRDIGQQILLAEGADGEMDRIVRQFALVFAVEIIVFGVLMPVEAHAQPFHHRTGLQAQVVRQHLAARAVRHMPIGPQLLFRLVGADQEQLLFRPGQGDVQFAHLFSQEILLLLDGERLARQGRVLHALVDVEVVGPQAVFLGEDVAAPGVAQVEALRQVHQEDDRELQPFAGMDGHHPHRILVIAEGGRLRQVLVALLDLLDEADELEQALVVRFLVFLGPLVQSVQVGGPLFAGDHPPDVVQEVGVVVDRPDQA